MRGARFLPWFALVALAASCAPVGPPPPDKNGEQQGVKKSNDITVPIKISGNDLLKDRIEQAVALVDRRTLLASHGFWTVFHAILGQGPRHATLTDYDGNRVNAMKYVADGGKMPGLQGCIVRTDDGIDVLSPKDQVFMAQGHQDQFVAEMTQWGLPRKYPFVVEGKPCSFEDFIRFTKARARASEKQELSWAILVIAEYEGTKGAWTNRYGEKLTFEDIVRYELNESIEKAACGGTHRLFGLTWALHRHLEKGGKLEGIWKQVADKLEVYKRRAKELRNGDGTFSTLFFEGRGADKDPNRRINTTGHTVEWLALAMTDQELRSPWMEEAVNALTKLFFDHSKESVDGGSLYHALHGLLIYYARVYGPQQLGDMVPHLPPFPKK
jgi:hypothetical protein